MLEIFSRKVESMFLESLNELSEACQIIKKDKKIMQKYDGILEKMKTSVRNGNTIFFCGNGGSFSDSQHLTAELIVRFELNRDPIKAICLGSNQSNLTAIGNDFSYEDIFVRELSALYKNGDLVFILSTSGNSPSILKVAKFLINKDEIAVALLGRDGGLASQITDSIVLPFEKTSLIQELQIVIGHSLCKELEAEFAKND